MMMKKVLYFDTRWDERENDKGQPGKDVKARRG